MYFGVMLCKKHVHCYWNKMLFYINSNEIEESPHQYCDVLNGV